MTVHGGEESQEARRSRTLPLLQHRQRRRRLMKRPPLLPRLIGLTRNATVATGAREASPRRSLRPLSAIKATDLREEASFALTLAMLSRSSSVDLLQTSTTSAGRCLATTTSTEKRLVTHTLATEVVPTAEVEEAELTSRSTVAVQDCVTAMDQDPPTKSVTATATCPATEEGTTSTSLSTTGKTAGASSTTSQDQATTPLPEDQSDLPWALP